MLGTEDVIGVANPYGLIQMAGKSKKKSKSRTKTQKRRTLRLKSRSKRKLYNANKQSCKSKKMKSCCPHMPPNHKGEYAATTKSHILDYLGNKYTLYTCCSMCAQQMNQLSRVNPKQFRKKYILKKTASKLYLKNQATGKLVQIANKKSPKTKKNEGKMVSI